MEVKLFSCFLLKHTFSLILKVYGLLVFSTLSLAKPLVLGIENEIKDYNITRSLDKNAFALSELLTEGLFYQNVQGQLVPDLLVSYARSGRVWTLKFRPSRFHDGSPLSCQDVLINMEEARKSPRPVRSRLKDIESLKCEGQVLRVTTQQEAPHLMARLGHIIRVYKPSTLGESIPIGSGPYRVDKVEGKDIVLKPNTHFKGTFKYTELRLRVLRDPWLRDLAVFSGNVDFLLENFSLSRLKSFDKKKDKVSRYQNPSPNLYYFALSTEDFNLDQRKRFSQALENSSVVQSYWGENVQQENSFFNSPLEKQKSGFNNKNYSEELLVELSLHADETLIVFLKELAKDLKKQGVILRLLPMEFASFMAALNARRYKAYLHNVDTSHPLNLESLLRSRGGRLGIKDSEVDNIFDEISSTGDEAKMDALLKSLEEQIAKNLYMIPLYRAKKQLVIQKELGLVQSDKGFWRDLVYPRRSL